MAGAVKGKREGREHVGEIAERALREGCSSGRCEEETGGEGKTGHVQLGLELLEELVGALETELWKDDHAGKET